MCDYGGVPYNLDMQTAIRTSSMRGLPDPVDPPVTPSGLLLHPPTATAAAWEATEKGLSQHSTNARIQEAIDRQQILEQSAMAQGLFVEFICMILLTGRLCSIDQKQYRSLQLISLNSDYTRWN